jgi:hypothetical protein
MSEVAKFHGAQSTAVAAQPDPMVSMIERLVVDPSADLDKLERMLAMKERIDAQNAQRAFASALSMARAEIPPIIKDATVDYKSKDGKRTHYQHETLAGIAKVIDPILTRYGLSYRFRTGQGNDGVSVTCIIQHSDGYAEETSLSGSPDTSGSKNGFQAVGSAVTYLQRYTLKAALGLSAEVDDDAQGAQQRQDAVPSFNARAAADRIITKLRRAASMDDLATAWREEAETLADIKEADARAYASVEAEKNARKADLAARPVADLGDDSIPY